MKKLKGPCTKFGHFIVTQTLSELNIPDSPHNAVSEAQNDSVTMLSLGDSVVPGSFLLRNRLYRSASEEPAVPDSHSHDSDEVLAFFGTNPDDWKDLGGVVEFWIEDEQHYLTQSCVIYIPKGVNHCPMWIREVRRPIFHYAVLPARTYMKA